MQPGDGPSRRALILGAGGTLGVGACGAPTDSASPSVRTSVAVPAIRTASATASPTASATPTEHEDAVPTIVTTPGPDISHGVSDRDEVALTFHGQGPQVITQQVLAACAAHQALITVFAVGTWVQDNPEQINAVAAAGHQVGNHSWSHQQMPSLSAGVARTEVALGKDALRAAGLDPGWAFRPSGTRLSTPRIRAAATASGYQRCISYDVDPEDWLEPGAKLVRSRTKAKVRPGSIVSLHLGYPGTAEALPGILTDLTTLGLKPVTLSTLLHA